MQPAGSSEVSAQRRLVTPAGSDTAQPRNFLQACLLLFLRESPAHGYALIERLQEIGQRSDRGVVYRTLRALEREDLVQSTWESSSAGPSKRSYSLTPTGERMLVSWATSLAESAKMLEAYLERYRRVTIHPPAED